MSKQNLQFNYWNSNIDPKNLSKNFDKKNFNYNEEKEFYLSPEQIYAYDIIENFNGKRILEIGCGIGINAIILEEKGADVTVLDISANRLETLKEISNMINKNTNIRLVLGQAESLPFRDNSFDIIYTKSVLIHTNLIEASNEIHRVLKKDGMGIFIEPMDLNPFVLIYRKLFAPKEWKGITNYFTPKRFEQFGKVFISKKGKCFYFFSFFAFYWQFQKRSLKNFKKYLPLLNKLDNFIFKYFPFMKRFAWFNVYCVKK